MEEVVEALQMMEVSWVVDDEWLMQHRGWRHRNTCEGEGYDKAGVHGRGIRGEEVDECQVAEA